MCIERFSPPGGSLQCDERCDDLWPRTDRYIYTTSISLCFDFLLQLCETYMVRFLNVVRIWTCIHLWMGVVEKKLLRYICRLQVTEENPYELPYVTLIGPFSLMRERVICGIRYYTAACILW